MHSKVHTQREGKRKGGRGGVLSPRPWSFHLVRDLLRRQLDWYGVRSLLKVMEWNHRRPEHTEMCSICYSTIFFLFLAVFLPFRRDSDSWNSFKKSSEEKQQCFSPFNHDRKRNGDTFKQNIEVGNEKKKESGKEKERKRKGRGDKTDHHHLSLNYQRPLNFQSSLAGRQWASAGDEIIYIYTYLYLYIYLYRTNPW